MTERIELPDTRCMYKSHKLLWNRGFGWLCEKCTPHIIGLPYYEYIVGERQIYLVDDKGKREIYYKEKIT